MTTRDELAGAFDTAATIADVGRANATGHDAQIGAVVSAALHLAARLVRSGRDPLGELARVDSAISAIDKADADVEWAVRRKFP